MNCPIKIPKLVRICEVCMFSKEGKCDYPYSIGMKPEEIVGVTKRDKDGAR